MGLRAPMLSHASTYLRRWERCLRLLASVLASSWPCLADSLSSETSGLCLSWITGRLIALSKQGRRHHPRGLPRTYHPVSVTCSCIPLKRGHHFARMRRTRLHAPRAFEHPRRNLLSVSQFQLTGCDAPSVLRILRIPQPPVPRLSLHDASRGRFPPPRALEPLAVDDPRPLEPTPHLIHTPHLSFTKTIPSLDQPTFQSRLSRGAL